MVRRYCEPVEVKAVPSRVPDDLADDVGERPGPVPGQPEAFLWRGRLYVVRAVLGHWRERRAWWHDALDSPPGQEHGIAAAARERQVWRVEASPGRSGGSGVFDLVGDDPHPGGMPVDAGIPVGARSGAVRSGADPGVVRSGVDPGVVRAAGPATAGGWELRRVLD
ncbi:MAG: DUF6504 family protein [Dermatophilaceae bacterium]